MNGLQNLNLSSSYRPSQPLCIQLLPPLQLCNVLSQPLLYRVSNKDAIISSEVRNVVD